MKKKIFILITIILLSFFIGVCINYFLSPKKDVTVITDPERVFNTNRPPVSNSDPRGNKHIFKSFFAYDTNIDLKKFVKNEEFYYKKITSYLEYLDYKKLIPELRTLTREDFVNYFLIIAISEDIEYIYMLKDIDNEENSMTLNILKNKSLSSLPQPPFYTGISIVLPNTTEVPIENINLLINK